jgi:hypothetical protein
VVEGVTGHELAPDRARLVSNVMHWAYGIGNGVQYGIVAGRLRTPRIRDGFLFGATVWGSGYVILPILKLYKPIWEYDAKPLAHDLSAHLVYGLAKGGHAADAVALGRSHHVNHARRCLRRDAQGVGHAADLRDPGDSLNGQTDALRRDREVTWEHVRHEESAAFAACDHGELLDRCGPPTTSSPPRQRYSTPQRVTILAGAGCQGAHDELLEIAGCPAGAGCPCVARQGVRRVRQPMT